MLEDIYIVETLQYKNFSYSFSPTTTEGGYHLSLDSAHQALEHLKPRMGLWVLISKAPLGVPHPDTLKEPLELYEYLTPQQGYRRCVSAETPIERLIFRVLNIPYSGSYPRNFRKKD